GVPIKVFRIRRHGVAAAIGPSVQVGDGVEHAPAELAKARPAAQHALLFQRARRQTQVVGRFAIGQVARRCRRRGGKPGRGRGRWGYGERGHAASSGAMRGRDNSRRLETVSAQDGAAGREKDRGGKFFSLLSIYSSGAAWRSPAKPR